MPNIFHAVLATQTVLIICMEMFFYISNEAMSKDGIGDPEKWQTYNNLGGITLYASIAIWLFTIVYSAKTKKFHSNKAQLSIALPPTVLMALFILSILH